MEPARVSTEKLPLSNINLLIGEGCLEFVLSETRQYVILHPESQLAKNFLKALEERLDKRRETEIIALTMYLNNQNTLTNHPLKLAPKEVIIKLGIEFLRRLFPTGTQSQGPESETSQANVSNSSLHDRLELSLGKLQSTGSPQPQAYDDGFAKEFEMYERHKVRGPVLDKLYDALSSVQPTSTQSERNFSLAAVIATPKRARIAPKKINATCFLKGYFKNHK